MAKQRLVERKKCLYCGREFNPDPRVGQRQKACSAQCRKLRKKDNNREFSKNNPGYWQGRSEYVKQWRQSNPDYQRQWRQKKKQSHPAASPGEIQAEILRKAVDCIERNLIALRKIQAGIIIKAFDITAKKAFPVFKAP